MGGYEIMVYEKLLELSNFYMSLELDSEKAEAYSNQYQVIFSNFTKELEKEVDERKYDLMDDINLVCDSYEKNVDIRENDDYCIDEKELMNKVQAILQKLLQ